MHGARTVHLIQRGRDGLFGLLQHGVSPAVLPIKVIVLALAFDRPDTAIGFREADKNPVRAVSPELLQIVLRNEVLSLVTQRH